MWLPTTLNGSGSNRVALSDAVHHELAALARSEGVGFLSAPFTVERAQFLVEEMGLQAIKVASSEMLNLTLLDYLAQHVRTIYLSTGLADLNEVRLAVQRLHGIEEIVIMHCVTQYPLSDADANLRAIQTLAEAFPDRRMGYSDHTIGLLAPLLAVALGVTVIEKHFTLDRSLAGSDHVLSVTPSELTELINGIRRAELLLGSPEKRPVEGELEIRELVRSRFSKQ